MLTVCCISDTHLMQIRDRENELRTPPVDLLIHSGDHTGHGSRDEWVLAMRWLGRQQAGLIVTTPGNHDFFTQDEPDEARQIAQESGVLLLIDEECLIPEMADGLRIYGSPWQPWFHDWAYNFPENDIHTGYNVAETTWAKIPEHTDILITHGPPYGLHDAIGQKHYPEWDDRVGCRKLLERIQIVQPRLHVFGHIHEGYGLTDHHWSESASTKFVNASTCTRRYVPTNPPIVFSLETNV